LKGRAKFTRRYPATGWLVQRSDFCSNATGEAKVVAGIRSPALAVSVTPLDNHTVFT